MASYTRQSTFSDGDLITAELFNDEYNQLLAAFENTTGHKHDGTVGEGPVISIIGDAGLATPLNKILIDTTNDHIEFWVDVSGTSTQQLYITDGAILPVTDNDIDLGSNALQFKDLYINGTANIDTVDIDAGTIDGVTIGGNSAGAITGTTITATNFVIGSASINETELEILDGATLTTTELNYVDGVTSSIQTQIDTKAPLASPSLTGIPTAPTAASNTNTTQIATTAYVQAELTDLIDGAPGTLDTLNELAAAINDDANYNTTLTTALATKLPLAGGTMTGDVTYSDNVKAQFGTSQDLQIYHDGSNSYVKDAGTGNLKILADNLLLQRADQSQTYIQALTGGAVDLRYAGAAKLATTSTGIDVTGTVTADGVSVDGNINLGDNDSIYLGDSNDLRIYHDSGSSLIRNTTGSLYIQDDDGHVYIRPKSGQDGLVAIADGAVTLHHSGNAKLATTSSGIDVTGTVTSDGLTVDTDTLHVDATNNRVGIGTTSASEKLTIEGNTFLSGDNRHVYFGGGNTFIGERSNSTHLELRGGGSSAAQTVYIDNNGRLGLGTASPALQSGGTGIHVNGTSYSEIKFTNSTTGTTSTDGTALVTVGTNFTINNRENGYFSLNTNNSERLRVDSSGRLGIGTTSPNTPLDVRRSDASGAVAEFHNNVGYGIDIGTSNTDAYISSGYLQNFIFKTNAGSGQTERIRIDSSGNFLVGKTASDFTVAGHEMKPSSFAAFTRNGGTPLIVNRLSSDGDIIEFYKGTSSVGSIGTMNFGDMYLGTDDTGIYFNNGIDSISPINTTNQTVRDNAIDLGASNARFKDLYLSGTANFGSLSDGTITITGFVDEDNMSSNSATLVPTQQSVKAYVDSQVSSAGGNGISFEDNEKAQFGDGNDLQIYHDGNNSNYIKSTTSDIYLRNEGDNDKIYIQATNSGTLANYLTIDGNVGLTKFNKNTNHPDNVETAFGDSGDLKIYHNGITSNSNIENYTGGLYITNYADDQDIIFRSDDGSGNVATYFQLDGSQEQLKVHKNMVFFDNVKASFGDSADLQIYHDGNNSRVEDTGIGGLRLIGGNFVSLQSTSGENMVVATENGAVTLYHDNNAKLATTSTGIDVTGTVNTDSLTVTGDIEQTTGDLKYTGGINWDIAHHGASQNIVFKTTPSGGSATEVMRIDSSGRVGIGTSSPDATLKVVSSSATTLGSWVRADNYGLRVSAGSTSSHYALRIANSSDATLATFNGDGKVGIGTASPSEKLEIANNASVNMKLNNTGQNITLEIGAQSSAARITAGSGDRLGLGAGNTQDILNIASGGNVGIGDTAPQDYLEINGSGKGLGGLTISNSSASHAALSFARSSTATARIKTSEPDALHTSALHFQTSDASGGSPNLLTAMYIDENQRVGIGTTSPRSNYSLDVRNAGNSGVNIQAGDEAADIALSVGSAGTADKFVVTAGGSVGIGNTNPDGILQATHSANSENHISYEIGNSAVASTNRGGFAIYELGTKKASWVYNRDGSGQTDFSADRFRFRNNAETTEYARIDSSGNLLVGKTSLTIANAGTEVRNNGQLLVTADGDNPVDFNRLTSDGTIANFRKDSTVVGKISTYSSGIDISNSTYGVRFAGSTIFPVTSVGSVSDNVVSLGYSSGRFKDLYLSGTAYTNGVGIGTSSVIGKLHANDSAGATLTLTRTSGATSGNLGKIRFGNTDIDSDLASIVAIQDGATNNSALTFGTQTAGAAVAERMRIDSTGGVGIGTINPQAALHVAGGFNATAPTGNGVMMGYYLNSYGYIQLNGTSGGYIDFSTSGTDHKGRILYDNTDNYLRLDTNGSERLRIDSSGRLLVGTTSVGYSGVDLTVGATTDSQNGVSIQTSTTGIGYLLFGDGTGASAYVGQIAYAHSDNSMQFDTAGAERMRIDSSGNVGIGTDSPTVKLEIQENTNSADVKLRLRSFNSSSAGRSTYIAYNPDTRIMGFGEGGDELNIDQNGKVGIGTASPDGNLEVVASSVIDSTSDTVNNVLIGLQSANRPTIVLDTADTTYTNRSWNITNVGAVGSLVIGRHGLDVLNLKNDGKVGIGTTSPVTPLHVSTAKSSVTDSVLTLQDSSTTFGKMIEFVGEGSTDCRGIIGFQEPQGNAPELYITNGGTESAGSGVGLAFWQYISTARIAPCDSLGDYRDDEIDLGWSNARFDDIYATNGTIQTSDRNDKQDIQALTAAETRVATACKGLLRKFRWQDAVTEKGDEARYHFGIIAQDLQDAFTAEGLDAGDYGMFISQTWEDSNGVEQTRLGVRYSELLAFIIAAI